MRSDRCPSCDGEKVAFRAGTLTVEAALCECVAACSECGGSGWQIRVTSSAVCGCQRLVGRVRLLNATRLPARYWDSRLSNFVRRVDRHDHHLEFLRRWVGGFQPRNKGLLFVGPVGLGKTHLAIGLLRQLMLDRGVATRFVEWLDLLSQVRATFNSPGTERDVLQPLIEAPVLLVDELGKGRRGSEWELGILDQLIGARYNRQAPTIFTTNYPLQEGSDTRLESGPADLSSIERLREYMGEPSLREKVGNRIFSRVVGMSTPLELRGAPDYRVAGP
jgi:DNA replication protein DnaC